MVGWHTDRQRRRDETWGVCLWKAAPTWSPSTTHFLIAHISDSIARSSSAISTQSPCIYWPRTKARLSSKENGTRNGSGTIATPVFLSVLLLHPKEIARPDPPRQELYCQNFVLSVECWLCAWDNNNNIIISRRGKDLCTCLITFRLTSVKFATGNNLDWS